MTISENVKKLIEEEYKNWESVQYVGKDKKERQKLGQFFTPPTLTMQMLEKFESIEDKDILDPTVGAGSLLAAAVLAGADPKRCFGIELDENVLAVAKKRLGNLGIPPCNLIQGNALDSKSYDKL